METPAPGNIEDHLGLVHWVVGRMSHLLSGKVERDDLVNDGVIGLAHALENFDPSQGRQFSTYAAKCIWGQILSGQRRLYREHWLARNAGIESNTLSIHHVNKHRYLGDSWHQARQTEGRLNTAMVLQTMGRYLTPGQLEVFTLLRQGARQTEIADRLGITRQAVSMRYRGGLRRLRERYGG